MSFPTSVPHSKRTPSASISAMRRATTLFGSFMLGMPYTKRPPGRWSRSYTVTACPRWFKSCATVRPAGPDPITATVLPLLRAGICGCISPWSNAASMMKRSLSFMETALAVGVALRHEHARSHGAGHTYPVNSGKQFVFSRRSSAMGRLLLHSCWFHSGIRLFSGQPTRFPSRVVLVWQNGTPQSMQRAACCSRAGVSRHPWMNSKSAMRVAAGRSGAACRA